MLARLSLKSKLTALVVIIVSVASSAFGYFASSGLLNLMTKASGQGAISAAKGLTATIDADWFATAQAGQGDAQSAELQALLKRAMQGHYIRRVYLVRFVDSHHVEHIVDLPVDQTRDYNPPGTIENLPDGAAYLEEPTGYSGVGLDIPGTYIAGWAPVEKGNKTIGVLMVVVDGSEIQSMIDTISTAILAVLVAFVLVAGLLAYKFAAGFEKTAVTDGLMGIYNHKYFKQRLEQEVHKASRYGQQTSLVLLDIDFFKRVNDTYGHATGDITLKSLAKWVSESTRTSDIVCRYGGEEIAIILPHTGVAGAQEFAERLRLKISQQVVKDPGEKAEFRVTVSIGVAQWEKGVNMIDLIKRTDAALYHSKNTGRNRVTIYQDDILKPPADPQPKKQAR